MVYRGQVCGDVIVLNSDVRLPEGTEVLVEPIAAKAATTSAPEIKLRNGIAVFESTRIGPPPDLDLVNKLRDDEL
jgi:hypothetical protein